MVCVFLIILYTLEKQTRCKLCFWLPFPQLQLQIKGFDHIHVMRPVYMSELEEEANCNMCGGKIHDSPCGDICHPLCIQSGKQGLVGHPLHPDHRLTISLIKGSECFACQLSITKYGYHCSICKFHIFSVINKFIGVTL